MAPSRVAGRAVLIVMAGLLFLPFPVSGGEGGKGDECQALDKMPELISQAAPVYPKRALEDMAEGKVILGLRVTAEGVVDSVVVKQDVEGYPEFADAAAAAARQWRFTPAEIKGKQVTAWVAVPVMFKLDKEKESKPK